MRAVLFVDAGGAQPGPHPLQRGLVGAIAQELRDGVVQHPLGLVLRDAGRRHDGQREGRGIDRQPVVARARVDRLAGQHQFPPQHRRLRRSAQQLGQHGQRRRGLLVAGVAFRRNRAAGQHRLRHARVPHLHPPLGALRGLLRAGLTLGAGLGRDGPVMLLGQLADLVRRHVARHDQHGHVRGIVAFVPVKRVGAGQPLHLGPPADHRAAVGMVVELHRRHFLAEERGGVAVRALRPLLQHDLAFRLPVVLADAEIGHPVRLHPHDKRQAVGGDALEVGGEVVAGEGVVGPAVGGHRPGQLARRQRFGALEHQVFQVMREPGLARHLVGRPDPVPHHLHHDRRAVILDHHRLQAVVEREAADARRHLGRDRRRGQQRRDQRERRRGKRGSGQVGARHRLLLGGKTRRQVGRGGARPQATDA